MPFQSEKQRKYLWANEPEIAREWTDTYGSGIAKALGGRIGMASGMSPGEAQARGLGAQHHGSTTSWGSHQGNVGSGGGEGFVPGIGTVRAPKRAPTRTLGAPDFVTGFASQFPNYTGISPKRSALGGWGKFVTKMRGWNEEEDRPNTQKEYEENVQNRRDRASIDRLRKTRDRGKYANDPQGWEASELSKRLGNLEREQFGLDYVDYGRNRDIREEAKLREGITGVKTGTKNNIIDPSGKVNYSSMFGIPSLDRLGTGLSQIVANMPKYWSLPKNIRDAIRTGKNIPFAHGTKNLDDYAKLGKTGFQNLRTKYIPTIHDWLKGTNPFKAEGVFGAVGDDALKSATQYAKGTSLRGTPFGKVTGDVFQGAIDPAKAYINRGLTGVVQGRVPSAIANQAFNLPNASKMSKVLGTPALHKIAGRALPGANIALGGHAALQHLKEGDYGQALMAGISAVPGPIGWAGLAGEYGLSALDNMAPINPYAPENTLVMNQGGLATLWPR